MTYVKMSWVAVSLTIVLGLCAAEAGLIGDQCDWTGSGLSSTNERAVTPVYLRCREGTVSWLYPRGALRLLFRPLLPAEERDFRVCIRVVRRSDPPDLFHEGDSRLNDIGKVERFPARLFVEGAHRLIPLYAPDDEDARELRCFRSRRGHAAIYVEADPEDGPKRTEINFQYETRQLVRRHYDPDTADCRPCSDSELELAFCTSELVSRGVIVGSEEREDLDSTQLTLRLTKLIRATGSDDYVTNLDLQGDHYYRYDLENTIEPTTHRNHSKRRKERSLHAHIHVSSVCGATAGVGEFLIMARRRLGRYSLICAPRIEDWVKLAEKRNAEGTAHCVLQH